MKRRILIPLFCSLLIAALVLPGVTVLAAKEITIDDDEYNLYTDNFPDPIGDDVYAKFTGSVKDVDEYYLNFDQDEAETPFKTALDKNKVSYNEDYICYMKPFLYKYDEDGGDDKSVTNQKVEIYFPFPMDAQEHPEDCAFYKLSSGKLTQVLPLDIYSIDEIYYIKMTLGSSTDFSAYYGFVYKNPEEYDEEDDGSGSDDESDEEEEFEEDDITPTPKPTATPTPKPEEKAPTPTPVPKTDSGNKNNNTGSKNTIPKTGDDFPLAGLLYTGAGAALILSAACFILRKKK